MSDERALLAAICAHPEEDTPRLAYADWLDEYAGSMPKQKRESVHKRAEFIRVQCELARLPPEEEDADTATRRARLELRQEELADFHSRQAWAEPLDRSVGSNGLHISRDSYVRGFPDFATGAVGDFLNAGEALFEMSPVRIIRCSNIGRETADPFLAQLWLTRARRMSITIESNSDGSGGPDENDVVATEKLFAARTLAALEELVLRNWEFGPPGRPLAGRALSSLRSLELWHGRAWFGTMRGPQTFVRLGELLPSETRLRDFLLGEMNFSADGLRAFADLPQVRRLERLTLDYRSFNHASLVSPDPNVPVVDYLGPEGVRAITSAPFWVHLRAFRDAQGHFSFTPAEVEELAAAPPAPHLRTLSLRSGSAGLRALSESAVLESVTRFELSGGGWLVDGSLQALAKSTRLNRLLNLQLPRCGINPEGVKALAEAPWAANVVRLNLSHNSVHKAGTDVLASPRAFPRLRYLDVKKSVKRHSERNRLRARFGDGARF